MDKQEIALALKKARKNAGLLGKEVAANIGKSEKAVSAWEQCNGQPNIGMLIKLRDLYNLSSIDEILGVVSDSGLVSSLRTEERDLVEMYRKLTPNSKQIITTLTQMELKHVDAVRQGETPIRILPKPKEELESAIDYMPQRKLPTKRELLKTYTHSAAAGYGNYIEDVSAWKMVAVPSIPHGTEFGIKISGDSMQPKINDGDIAFVKRQPSIEVGDIGIFIYNNEAFCKQLAYKDNTYYLHSLNNDYKDIPIFGDSIYTVGKVLGSYNEDSDND